MRVDIANENARVVNRYKETLLIERRINNLLNSIVKYFNLI